MNEQPDDQLRTLWGDFEVWVEEQSRAGDVSEASELVAPEYESGQSRTAPGVALKAELYFPAFCLLKRRGLVQQMAEQLITDDLALEGSEQSEEGAEEEGVLAALQPALQLYTTLHQLIQVDSTENTDLTPDHAERSIALRKQLSDLSLPLMRLYLELS